MTSTHMISLLAARVQTHSDRSGQGAGAAAVAGVEVVSVLLVDAANVVGSKPTGWWRDRPGAARRLHEQVSAAVAAGRLDPPVVLVLEGVARAGVPEGEAGGVTVVHAAGSGDDALVEVAARAAGGPTAGAGVTPVLLVTADRGLRERAGRVGADSVGPSWLYDRL